MYEKARIAGAKDVLRDVDHVEKGVLVSRKRLSMMLLTCAGSFMRLASGKICFLHPFKPQGLTQRTFAGTQLVTMRLREKMLLAGFDSMERFTHRTWVCDS